MAIADNLSLVCCILTRTSESDVLFHLSKTLLQLGLYDDVGGQSKKLLIAWA